MIKIQDNNPIHISLITPSANLLQALQSVTVDENTARGSFNTLASIRAQAGRLDIVDMQVKGNTAVAKDMKAVVFNIDSVTPSQAEQIERVVAEASRNGEVALAAVKLGNANPQWYQGRSVFSLDMAHDDVGRTMEACRILEERMNAPAPAPVA